MKKFWFLPVILSFLFTYAEGQTLSVTSFSQDADSFSGQDCALVRISTKLVGLSFDSGIDCISDVVYKPQEVWLYLPASAKYLTISHATCGTVSRWRFPQPLEEGRVYDMTLKSERPKPIKPTKPAKYTRSTKPARPASPSFYTAGFSNHFLQSKIGMLITDGDVDGAVFGLNYSFVPGRFGFTTSFDWSVDSGFAMFAGPSLRVTGISSPTDWQIYACPGYVFGCGMAVDVGTRFGWRSGKAFSRYDFSIGCQYWGGDTYVPYVGLGAKITLVTTIIVLGVFLGVAGGF